MPQPLVFVDSNIWLYLLMIDTENAKEEEQRKNQIAKSLIQNSRIIISSQIINEVCSVLYRKAKFKEAQLQKIITEFYQFCSVIPLKQSTQILASQLRMQYALSFWDSLIVAGSLEADATILYSEDMQHGLIINNQVTIINPFQEKT